VSGIKGVQKNPKPKIEPKNQKTDPKNRLTMMKIIIFSVRLIEPKKIFGSRIGFGSAGPKNAVNRS